MILTDVKEEVLSVSAFLVTVAIGAVPVVAFVLGLAVLCSEVSPWFFALIVLGIPVMSFSILLTSALADAADRLVERWCR